MICTLESYKLVISWDVLLDSRKYGMKGEGKTGGEG